MQIGTRVIKTGIAVSITMFVCKLVGLEPAFFGAVSALINMQPSIFLTLRAARDQILVHVIGVSAGCVVGYFMGVNPFTAGIIVMLLIPLYIKLRLGQGITMGVVAALFVLSAGADEFITQAFIRSGVIFVGLVSAMLVNVLLWPPKYENRLREKLREGNEAAVLYFCRAVQEYVGFDGQSANHDKEQRARVRRLNKEARGFLEMLSRDRQIVAETPEAVSWLELAEKMVDYNESIMKKGDRIFDLLDMKLDGRMQLDWPPHNEEYRAVLNVLESGCTIVIRLNGKLRTRIVEGAEATGEEISESYWISLTQALAEWQGKQEENSYIHGLMEVAVTANEIKWATRQAKILLQESLENT